MSKSLGIQNFNFSEFFLNPAAQIAANNSNKKVTNLTIRNDVIDLIKKQLLNAWTKLLHSNVADVELTEIYLTSLQSYLNYTFRDDTTLVLNYLIKLDPRIQKNGPVIFRMVNLINSTLRNENSSIYARLISSQPHFQNDTKAVLLQDIQIGCKLIIDLYLFIFRSL